MLIQFKRGNKVDLPILESGEPAFTTDTKNLYIGTGTENVQIAGDQTYTHIQSVPAMVWTVTLPEWFKEHPGVVITDSAGTQVFGEVNYSYPVVTLSFAAPFGGQAHFN
ncbi:hypothetical protein [Acetobacterium wieringae]|uniref:Major tropism determinant N-terminal domain-containing protein n=1 Tax=Acetobacterium wieringae TaxID=52694 RepID=A0A1F2PL22_9FIRM|nr:hypothetical protein [Acetobacterium wieringae]OFV72119.1 hypothetical protein ACWI_03690 [Acetobacterium wieringae]